MKSLYTFSRLFFSLIFVLTLVHGLLIFNETLYIRIRSEITQLQGNAVDVQKENLKLIEEIETTNISVRTKDKEIENLSSSYDELTSDESIARISTINAIFDLYSSFSNKKERNEDLKLEINNYNESELASGIAFLKQEFKNVENKLTHSIDQLDGDYNQYISSLPTATPTPIPSAPAPVSYGSGVSTQYVQTDVGTFYVYMIKRSLAEVSVKTITANTSDCSDNCPAKNLSDYVAELGGVAGMHGTYFCPPDYVSCAGKTYSYDYAVYNSSTAAWLNNHSIYWSGLSLGMAAFNGSTPTFYANSPDFPGHSVTAGLVNFPSLLNGGNIVVSTENLVAYQSTTKGTRGAIGTDGSNVYLVIASGATVPDMAYVMKAVGATDALNLDGGGSSALYANGSYVVGPGRLLPNAIVLVPR